MHIKIDPSKFHGSERKKEQPSLLEQYLLLLLCTHERKWVHYVQDLTESKSVCALFQIISTCGFVLAK